MCYFCPQVGLFIINPTSFPMHKWECGGKRWGRAIPSRPASRLEWMVNRDVAGNSLTEKGWCHQFSRLVLAALDSLPWIQQKTVETNPEITATRNSSMSFSSKPTQLFLFFFVFNLAFLSTPVLIFAVPLAVLIAYSKLTGAQGSASRAILPYLLINCQYKPTRGGTAALSLLLSQFSNSISAYTGTSCWWCY